MPPKECGQKNAAKNMQPEKKRLDEFIKPLFAYALLRLSG